MRAALPALLLAGCAAGIAPGPPPEPARPETVILYRDTLTVVFDDGSLCAGPRDSRREGVWAGRLGGCPHRLAYSVERAPVVARLALGDVDTGGWVVLEHAGGTLEFAPLTAPSS